MEKLMKTAVRLGVDPLAPSRWSGSSVSHGGPWGAGARLSRPTGGSRPSKAAENMLKTGYFRAPSAEKKIKNDQSRGENDGKQVENGGNPRCEAADGARDHWLPSVLRSASPVAAGLRGTDASPACHGFAARKCSQCHRSCRAVRHAKTM